MKKIYLLFIPVIALIAFAISFTPESPDVDKRQKLNKATRILEGFEHVQSRRINSNTGEYDPVDYLAALEQADLVAQSNGSRALNLSWEHAGPDNVGGRTRALLVDVNNQNKLYAGGVGGGFYISTDKGNTWTLSTNGMTVQTASSIAQGSNGDLFLGTGEGFGGSAGNSLNSGNVGGGMYKSTDGGSTWNLLTSTEPTTLGNGAWAIINRVAVNPNDPSKIVAANALAFWYSSDGGVTWNQGTGAAGTGQDLKYTSDGARIFGTAGNRVYQSDDNGMTWTNISGNVASSSFGRPELAVSPSDPNTAYLSIATSGGALFGIFQTKDKGNTWTQIGASGTAGFQPFSVNNQGWYDNCIAVNPADPDKLYMGGVEFWTWSPNTSWQRADRIGSEGGNNSDVQYVHADKHAIVFGTDPEVMYIGCDGGVYRSDNANSVFPYPTYAVKNRNLNTTQFYSVAASKYGEILGGTQDNGTQFVDLVGNTAKTARRVFGGDGIYSDVSLINPDVLFAGIYFGQAMRSGNKGSSFGTFFDSNIDPEGFQQPSACSNTQDASALFITPFLLGESFTATNNARTVSRAAERAYSTGEKIWMYSNIANHPFEVTLTAPLAKDDIFTTTDLVTSQFFLSTFCGVWMTPDPLATSTTSRWYRASASNAGTASCFAITNDGEHLYFGTTNGRIIKLSGLTSTDYDAITNPDPAGGIFTSTTVQVVGSSTRPITGLAIDPNDDNHIVATVGGYGSTAQVWRSTDGATFTNIHNNLPTMPAYDAVIDQLDADNIIIATELGVWSSDDAGSTWTEENGGELERVPVFRMRQVQLYEETCPVLYIGTHGRGFFRTTSLLAGSGCDVTPGKFVGLNDPMPGAEIVSVNVYPNPVSSVANVQIDLMEAGDVEISLIDLPGRIIEQHNYNGLTEGSHNFNDIDVSNLAEGNYLITVRSGNFASSRMINVSR